MTIVNVLPVLPVADLDAAVTWYETLFGRPPDRRPMDGLVEWQLADSGGVQVYRSDEAVGSSTVTINVDDVDGYVSDLAGRGISVDAFDVPSGQFRLATLQDPAGNTITIAQELDAADAT